MKAVILAGGLGTRISEETTVKPKPMVEIGGHPILWHIMKIYSCAGINDFIICGGYKANVIKEYFANYSLHRSDITFDLKNNTQTIHTSAAEPWSVTVVDTGPTTMTGGRLKRVREYIGDETFCFTYGDGLADINLPELIEFHKQQDCAATLTATQPPGRFGAFTLGKDQARITSFYEKPSGDGAWINGGYFVLEPTVIDYIDDDVSVWEQEPLQNLAKDGLLSAYKHSGFWQPMDTLRDKHYLESLWDNDKAPWKKW